MGRPTDLNEALAKRLAAHVSEGMTHRCAAGLEKVPWATYTNWLRWGEEGREPYLIFRDLTREAEAEFEQSLVETIMHRAGKKHSDDGAVKAAQWVLERRRREDWWLRPEQARDESKLSDTELVDALEKQLEAARERIAKAGK